MSRKIILYIAMSLDGYIADETGSVEWLSSPELVEEDSNYEDFIEGIGTVILGRKTYDQIKEDLSPDNYPYSQQESYVLTHRPEEDQEKISFTDETAVDLASRLKKEEGKDIWIVGGASIIQPLLEKNLIDQYQICILPLILGKGLPLFPEIESRIDLSLESVYSKNQMTYLSYKKRTS